MKPMLPPDVPPGMPDYAFNVGETHAQVQAALSECDTTVAGLLGRISNIVNDCLATCGGSWATCESCISGKINDRIFRANLVGVKCLGKVVDRAQVLFNQAAALASPVIAQVPGLADVIAANTIVPPAKIQAVGECGPVGSPTACGIPGPLPAVQFQEPGLPLGVLQPAQCPEGTVPQWEQQGDGSFKPVCTPYALPPTAAPVPSCPAIYPKPPPGTAPRPEPPCPPPEDLVCPEGQVPTWFNGAWQCRRPEGSGPPAGDPSDSPSFGELYFGFWNRLTCPPLRPTDEPLPAPVAGSVGVGMAMPSAGKSFLNDVGLGVVESINAPFNLAADGAGLFASGADWIASLLGSLWDALVTIGNDMVNLFDVGGPKPLIDYVQHQFFKRRDCDYVAMMPPITLKAVLGLVEQYTNVGFDDLITTLSYTINRACPTLLPGQAGIDQAFMGNQISEETWKCWTRAVNDLDVPAHAVLYAGRVQPNVQQWISAWQRGLVNDEEIETKIRGTGVLNQFESDIFKSLMEQIPPPTDLVRFMLRDVEDPAVIDALQLDAEFEEKFQGKVEEWAKGQGMPREVMLRYWRAHWQSIAPGQLYTMMHRLRKDSLDPAMAALEVTQALVEQVLGIDDVLPTWRKRLVAISYRLPRILDVAKFFNADIWGEPELLDYYQNYGYSPANAKAKTGLVKRLRQETDNKAARLLSKANLSNAFRAGVLSENEYRDGLRMIDFNDTQIDQSVREATLLRKIDQRKRVKNAIKCRFKECAIGNAEAVSALVNAGWDVTDALAEVTCWKQVCSAKGREASTAQLCEWYGLGLLSDAEYRSRLTKMGWSRDDVSRIIGQCDVKQTTKAAKAAKASKNGSV